MRQRTDGDDQERLVSLSKLPVRQRTYTVTYCCSGDLSKLPVRQRT
ncbi:conserved hypothetical protein [Nitrosomonas nitrosa]|uniref:Uncharacterized protein n=1 Tax=Nitrosomonas nitrosa TaxID=52442 RepID=A0A8H8Z186_9PROT|nr:conserved hypothetical protein [Nitrosomonas nitrosa]